MAYEINLLQRYSHVFGFAVANIVPRLPNSNIGLNGNLAYVNLATYDPANPVLGPSKDIRADVFESMVARGKAFIDVVSFEHPTIGDLPMDMLMLVDFSRQKNINSTIINENQEGGLPEGEVVESFGFKPWSIRMRGLLVDMEEKLMPTSALETLYSLYKIHDIVKVTSSLFSTLDITNIYFTDFSPEVRSDYQDTISFTLEARSHASIEGLIITN